MARLTPPDPARLSADQKRVHDAILAGPRGVVQGPLAVWLHRPGLADRAQALGQYCRYDSSLEKRLSELAILTTARIWGAEFEWWAHETPALEAGLAAATIEAIRTNGHVALDDPEEQVVHDVAITLNRTRRLDDALYARAIDVLGEGRLIDLIGVLGYYSFISMTINAFEVGLPPGSVPQLA